jgi:UDP-N-acetylmuramate dehydrogenase
VSLSFSHVKSVPACCFFAILWNHVNGLYLPRLPFFSFPPRREGCCTLKRVPHPPIKLQENVPLAPYTTLDIGGPARFFCEAKTEDEVAEAAKLARERDLPLVVLGGGSNLLVSDAGFDGLVMRVGMVGSKRESREGESVLLEAGAGGNWDEFVRYTVDHGYAGVECLAGIPGDVGGTPVQNVGAYGQEVAETIVRVRAYDLGTGGFVDLDREACRFGYRRSLFNTDVRGRHIVTGVTYKLRPGGEPALRYADVKRHFATQIERGERPTLRQVYDGVRSIREQKGMLAGQGGAEGRSAGSFFKNPVVLSATLPQVALNAGCGPDEVPHYPAGDDMVKLAAAWLVEQAGFHKGFAMGRAAISSRHTLALVNLGGATAVELIALRDAVATAVQDKFAVQLEQEPVMLGFSSTR